MQLRYEEAKKFRGRKVLVLRNNNQGHFGILIEVTTEKLYMETALDSFNTTVISFPFDSVQEILLKEHISFLNRKAVLDKKTDKAITWHIEAIKLEPIFTLQTRRYELQVNGAKKRNKWSARDFERAVAKWLNPKKPIELYPFALVKTDTEEFLLAIDRTRLVYKINKQGVASLA